MARKKINRYEYSIFIEAKNKNDIIKSILNIVENLKKEVTEQTAGLERNSADIKYKATCKYLNFQEAISVK